MNAPRTLAAALVLTGWWIQPAAAQSAGAAGLLPANAAPVPVAPQTVSRDESGRVTVRAVRISEPLTIDGRLDERWYDEVVAIDGFVQQEPREFQPASERSEAWIFFDNQSLYLAVRNWDSQPERMVVNEMRHDSSNLIQNEHMTFTLDTFHDRRNGYIFLVNALGGMLEEVFFDERNPSRDWNTVWSARTSRFEQGWTLEIEIPFKSLRYNPGAQTWGIQINRVVRWKNERTWLTPLPQSLGNAVFRVSSAATLTGLETPPPAKNIEVKPYAISGLTTDRTASPLPINNDRTGDIGVDVKYGLTRSLTADFTVNTDFAQVEEDEQQVNLTRFNLFFPEKREFFLEGQGIFNFGGRSASGGGDVPIMFFSRQIGISGSKPVPIIGGTRLTGRVGSFNVGVVNIQTADDETVGAVDTNFTAVRVRRDILTRSTIGALFTNRSASLLGESGANQTYGIDGLFSLYQNVRVDTYIARTQTEGRRDDDLSYRSSFDYTQDRYGFNAEYLGVGENFNPEVGFLRRRDFRKSTANLRFSPRPASARLVRKYYYQAGYMYLTTGTGRLESRNANASFRIELQSGDNFNADYARSYELLENPFRIATGVIIPPGSYSFGAANTSYQFGPQRRINGTVAVSRGQFYTGTQTAASYRGRIAVHPQLALEPAVSVNWVDLPEGEFTTKLFSTRATVPVSPRMFVSALLQYNSSSNAFSTNVRMRWEYQPGSELFVVWTEGRNTIGPGYPLLETRGLVVKITRLFRL